MATYRKKLLDKDGNTIIPALAGDETGWVNTGDLADGSVTSDKLASKVVNQGIKTADNITPSADTPAAWATAFGADGLYLTTYTTTGLFTDQIGEGNLETIVNGTEIVQKWYENSGVIWWRQGIGSTWNTTSSATGNSFLFIPDSVTIHVGTGIIIPSTADLNSAAYCMPGEYTGVGASMTNCPTNLQFRLIVNEVGRRLRVTPTSANIVVVRTLIDSNGAIFTQRVGSTSQGNWQFNAWSQVAPGTLIDHFNQGNNKDLNNFTAPGVYRMYVPITNGPSGNYTYATLFVTSYSEDYRCTQYFNGIDDTGKGVIAVRFSYYNQTSFVRSWSDWKILAQWT